MKNQENTIVEYRFQIRDSEAGNVIESFNTIEGCEQCIKEYEIEDEEAIGFYEIYDTINEEII
jgi:hypothetical protein